MRTQRIPLTLPALLAAIVLSVLPAATSADSATEHGLAAQAAAEAARLSAVSGDLATVQGRLDRLDADLASRRAQLSATQAQLRIAAARLVRLRLRLEVAHAYLAEVLVAGYEGDRPDLVTVVLDAKGFADLIERLDAAKRVKDADAEAVRVIATARREVATMAVRLGRLQLRERTQLEAVAARQEAVATVRARLAERQLAIARAHAHTVGRLRALRAQRRAILVRLARQQRAAARSLAPASPQVLSGGGFTFPMPAGAGVPESSWSLDQGVDIAAPGHTPLLAVGAGTVVGHGISGFGAWAPILHLDDGRTVYYGHAGPGNAVAIGTHVQAGQAIGEVGDGIVGISTGPHLEIGFCDQSGAPLGPGSAPAMMALLRAAHG